MLFVLPAPCLQPYVGHYWLSRDNTQLLCPLLPDGAIDLVLAVVGGSVQMRIYGTATTRIDLPLIPGAHYLGIAFRPGQARHFFHVSARELTDCALPANDLMCPGLDRIEEIAERMNAVGLFARLDRVLGDALARQQPIASAVDGAVAAILGAQGNMGMRDMETAGYSSRHFERVFLDAVGIPAKLFAQVHRFRHAAAMVSGTAMTLADIAAAAGYADQSHMTHAFRRFAGISPGAWTRRDVVFFQDRRPSPDAQFPCHSLQTGASS